MTESDASNSTAIKASNPLFIAPFDNPNFVLVSSVFTGIGFSSWKRSIIIALSAKNKLGFVDGSVVQPLLSSPEFNDWHRANSMVIGWILNSLSKPIAESVLFLQTAHEIWFELNQRYEQSDGALIYQIKQQLYSMRQGTDDFPTYFTKLA